MALEWYDASGTVGVALILASYLLVQLDRLSATSLTYLLANTAGASLILLSLVFRFNLAAFLVEAFWLGISLFGLARRLAGRSG